MVYDRNFIEAQPKEEVPVDEAVVSGTAAQVEEDIYAILENEEEQRTPSPERQDSQ